MPGNSLGPPNERCRPPAGAAPTTRQVDTQHSNAFDPLAGYRRRHAAKRRQPPLPPCGCIRDPEHDRHRCGGQISDHMAESAVAAVVLLDRLGTPALLDPATCRAIHRIGHHDLALHVYRRTAGWVA